MWLVYSSHHYVVCLRFTPLCGWFTVYTTMPLVLPVTSNLLLTLYSVPVEVSDNSFINVCLQANYQRQFENRCVDVISSIYDITWYVSHYIIISYTNDITWYVSHHIIIAYTNYTTWYASHYIIIAYTNDITWYVSYHHSLHQWYHLVCITSYHIIIAYTLVCITLYHHSLHQWYHLVCITLYHHSLHQWYHLVCIISS
jgi:hypothetical protein